MAAAEAEVFTALCAVDRVKLVLMQSCSRALLAKYRTMYVASQELEIDQERLSRMRTGQLELFSLAWLIQLADRVGLAISITVLPRD